MGNKLHCHCGHWPETSPMRHEISFATIYHYLHYSIDINFPLYMLSIGANAPRFWFNLLPRLKLCSSTTSVLNCISFFNACFFLINICHSRNVCCAYKFDDLFFQFSILTDLYSVFEHTDGPKKNVDVLMYTMRRKNVFKPRQTNNLNN